MEIVKEYVEELTQKSERTWSKKLITLYIECYKIMRGYYPVLNHSLCDDERRKVAYEQSSHDLLYHELLVDSTDVW